MRHRKKLLVATMLLAAAYAALCFWPHSNPEAVRALTTLRELIDVTSISSKPAANPLSESQIDVSVVVAKINITDATTGLFCKSRDKSGLTLGRVSDEKKMRDTVNELCSLGVFDMLNRPQMRMNSGQRGRMSCGQEVPVMVPATALAADPTLPTMAFRTVGTEIELLPEIRADDVIRLLIECKVEWVGGNQTIATPKRVAGLLNTQRMQTALLGHVKVGETLVIGGLAKKWDAPSKSGIPLLSELPGIDSWFSFRREREIEEELVILVTPRIVNPFAAR